MANIYKAKTVEKHCDGDAPAMFHVRWASSEGGAKKARRELCDKFHLKLNGADYEAVDMPTSKAGVIDWLNANHTLETA